MSYRDGATALALLLGVISCGPRESTAVPTETEVAVFTELVLIEAALQDFTGPTKDSLAERYYAQLYDRYGMTAADLDALRSRYNADVGLYLVMTDSVEARLQREQADPSQLLRPALD